MFWFLLRWSTRFHNCLNYWESADILSSVKFPSNVCSFVKKISLTRFNWRLIQLSSANESQDTQEDKHIAVGSEVKWMRVWSDAGLDGAGGRSGVWSAHCCNHLAALVQLWLLRVIWTNRLGGAAQAFQRRACVTLTTMTASVPHTPS